MKQSPLFIRILFVISLPVFIFSSCSKNDGDGKKTEVYPEPVRNIVSQSMIDSLRRVGVNIYDGTTPPTVNGIYFMHPDSCTYDDSPAHLAGAIFGDYKFRFTNQNNTNFTITVEQKNMVSGTLSPTPAASYICGSGNDFTIFILRTNTPGGTPVQQFNVLSGTVVSGGVQNFQNTLYMRSKGGDFNNVEVVPAGTMRVFITGKPGLATTSTTF